MGRGFGLDFTKNWTPYFQECLFSCYLFKSVTFSGPADIGLINSEQLEEQKCIFI